MTGPGELTILPCGCTLETLIEHGEKTLVIAPCRPDCKWLAFVLEESRRQGNRYRGAIHRLIRLGG